MTVYLARLRGQRTSITPSRMGRRLFSRFLRGRMSSCDLKDPRSFPRALGQYFSRIRTHLPVRGFYPFPFPNVRESFNFFTSAPEELKKEACRIQNQVSRTCCWKCHWAVISSSLIQGEVVRCFKQLAHRLPPANRSIWKATFRHNGRGQVRCRILGEVWGVQLRGQNQATSS